MQELEEEGRDDGGDRDPEDRARDAGDPAADQHRAEDDDRVDADRALHDPRLEDVHHDEPAGAHQDERREGRLRLEDERDDDRRRPRDERPEERDHLEQAGERPR